MKKNVDENGEIVSNITDMTLLDMVTLVNEGKLNYVSFGKRKSDGVLLVTVGVIPDGRLYAAGDEPDVVADDALALLRFVLTERPTSIAARIRQQHLEYSAKSRDRNIYDYTTEADNLHTKPGAYPF
jgi:hypothetical protein